MERRSRRPRKTVSAYDPLRTTDDRLLRIALKRSELEFKAYAHQQAASGAVGLSPLDSLQDAPTVQPTREQFDDPVALWNSLTELGLRYGAVKLRPPSGWKPPFCLDFETLTFTVREQKLDRLSSGGAFSFPRRLWNAQEFKNHADGFEERYKWTTTPSLPSFATRDYEREYWRLVETQASPVQVLYAADIEVNQTGSGFPDPKKKYPLHSEEMKYAHHPWNLLNLPNTDGSFLKYLRRMIPGVTCPWLYMGMLFSSFCWHTEDDYFAAVNYQQLGAAKIWYVIPPDKAPAMQRFLKDYMGHRKTAEVLHSLSVQVSPNLLVTNDIPVYRIVQSENEFVLLWPRTYHCGFNTGFNCNEACNIAPPIWLDWGHLAAPSYRFLRSPCIPYEQIIYLASSDYAALRCPEQACRLVSALTRLILEDFRLRQEIQLTQLPLIHCSHLLDLRQYLLDDAYKFRIVFPSNRPADQHWLDLQTVTQSSVSLLVDSPHVICEKFDALARLPASDCALCLAACYQGVVCCPHDTTPLCMTCAAQSKLPCRKGCNTAILLYRFPLRAQLHLLDLISSKAYELRKKASLKVDSGLSILETADLLPSSRAEAIELRHYGPFLWKENWNKNMQELPTPQAAELFEANRAAVVRLGRQGPFVWKEGSDKTTRKGVLSLPPTDDDLEEWLFLRSPRRGSEVPCSLEDLHIRLSSREILLALQREADDDATTTHGSDVTSDENNDEHDHADRKRVKSSESASTMSRSSSTSAKHPSFGSSRQKRHRQGRTAPVTLSPETEAAATRTDSACPAAKKQELVSTIQRALTSTCNRTTTTTTETGASSLFLSPPPSTAMTLLTANGKVFAQHAEEILLQHEEVVKTSWRDLSSVQGATEALCRLLLSKMGSADTARLNLEESLVLLKGLQSLQHQSNTDPLHCPQAAQLLESPVVFQQLIHPALKTLVACLHRPERQDTLTEDSRTMSDRPVVSRPVL